MKTNNGIFPRNPLALLKPATLFKATAGLLAMQTVGARDLYAAAPSPGLSALASAPSASLAPSRPAINCTPGSADERAACPSYELAMGCINRASGQRYIDVGGGSDAQFDCDAWQENVAAFGAACGVNPTSGAICPEDNQNLTPSTNKSGPLNPKTENSTGYALGIIFGVTGGIAAVIGVGLLVMARKLRKPQLPPSA